MLACSQEHGGAAVAGEGSGEERLRSLEALVLKLSARLEAQQSELEARLQVLEHVAAREVSKDASDSEIASEGTLLYSMGHTLWDATPLLGLQEMGGCKAGALLALAAMVNLAAQAYLTWTVLSSEGFVRVGYWNVTTASMENWRLTEAHESASVDASGVSLASRVCAQDRALSIANSQAALVEEINDYLGQDSEDFGASSFAAKGPMLCAVCIFLFSLVVLKELRNLAMCLHAFAVLPRGATEVEEGRIKAISRPRFACLAVMQTLRAGVAVSLLYAGTMWLAYTSEITELILNAAALGFVMDTDELLFSTLVPAVAQKFVAQIQPIRHRRAPFHLEALLPLAVVALVLCATISGVLLPNIESMTATKHALCGGWKDFAVRQNPLGYVHHMRTDSPEVGDGGRDMMEMAVAERAFLPDWDTKTFFSAFSATRHDFLLMTSRSQQDWAEASPCSDLDSFNGGRALEALTPYFMAVRHMSEDRGLAMEDTGRPWKPWRCRDYRQHCNTLHFVLLRLLCPVTCGCADPEAVQIFRTTTGGCPKLCVAALAAEVAKRPCADADVQGMPSWESYWRYMHAAAVDTMPEQANAPYYMAFIQGKIAKGCNDTSLDPVNVASYCHEEEGWLKLLGLASMRSFCPELCCVRLGLGSPQCPSACSGR